MLPLYAGGVGLIPGGGTRIPQGIERQKKERKENATLFRTVLIFIYTHICKLALPLKA